MDNAVDTYAFEPAKESFARFLTERGMRKTTERFTILEHICRIRGHFDVEMLLRQLDEAHFHVSRASIYNTLELLMDARIVVRHQFSSQLVQYELQAAAATHHHAICSYCGAVQEVKDDRLTRELAHRRIPKFTYDCHSLHIYGMCSKCKFRMRMSQRKAAEAAKGKR